MLFGRKRVTSGLGLERQQYIQSLYRAYGALQTEEILLQEQRIEQDMLYLQQFEAEEELADSTGFDSTFGFDGSDGFGF